MSISPDRPQARYDATKKQLAAAQAKLKDLDTQIGAKIEISAIETKKWQDLHDALSEATCKLEAFDLDPANLDVLAACRDSGIVADAASVALNAAVDADNAAATKESSSALKAAQAVFEAKTTLATAAKEAADLKRLEHDELVAKVASVSKACDSQQIIAGVAGQEADELISKLKDAFFNASSEVRRLNDQHNTQKAALAKRIAEYPTALASHLRKCTYTGKADIKNRTMNTVKEARKVISDYASASPKEDVAAKLAAALAS
jgi:hypothetical protein